MEEFAEFPSFSSNLIRSFWAGKLIQELHLTEDELHTSSRTRESSHDHSNPPHSPPPNINDQGQPSQLLISDALQCLAQCETSLSPRVRGIVTGHEQQESAEFASDGHILCTSNGTLDWSEVANYLDKGERETKQ